MQIILVYTANSTWNLVFLAGFQQKSAASQQVQAHPRATKSKASTSPGLIISKAAPGTHHLGVPGCFEPISVIKTLLAQIKLVWLNSVLNKLLFEVTPSFLGRKMIFDENLGQLTVKVYFEWLINIEMKEWQVYLVLLIMCTRRSKIAKLVTFLGVENHFVDIKLKEQPKNLKFVVERWE